jgi:hypothetical protein
MPTQASPAAVQDSTQHAGHHLLCRLRTYRRCGCRRCGRVRDTGGCGGYRSRGAAGSNEAGFIRRSQCGMHMLPSCGSGHAGNRLRCSHKDGLNAPAWGLHVGQLHQTSDGGTFGQATRQHLDLGLQSQRTQHSPGPQALGYQRTPGIRRTAGIQPKVNRSLFAIIGRAIARSQRTQRPLLTDSATLRTTLLVSPKGSLWLDRFTGSASAADRAAVSLAIAMDLPPSSALSRVPSVLLTRFEAARACCLHTRWTHRVRSIAAQSKRSATVKR